MKYYEVFTSEENDYEILQIKLDLKELESYIPQSRMSDEKLTDLLDEITHRAYEAGIRDTKQYTHDQKQMSFKF